MDDLYRGTPMTKRKPPYMNHVSFSYQSGYICSSFFSTHFQRPISTFWVDHLKFTKKSWERLKQTISHVKLGLSTSTLGHCFYFGETWIEAKTEPTAILRIAGMSLMLCDERMSLRAMVKTWDVLRKETGWLSIFNTR